MSLTLSSPTMATLRMFGRVPRVHPVPPSLSNTLHHVSSRVARAAAALTPVVSRRRATKVADALIAAAVPLVLVLAMASPIFSEKKNSRHYW